MTLLSTFILCPALNKVVRASMPIVFCHRYEFSRISLTALERARTALPHNLPSDSMPNSDPGKRYPRPSGTDAHRRFTDPLTPLSASRRQPLNPHRELPNPAASFRVFEVNNPRFNPPYIPHSRRFHRATLSLPPVSFPPFYHESIISSSDLLPIRNATQNRLIVRFAYDSRSTTVVLAETAFSHNKTRNSSRPSPIRNARKFADTPYARG